MNVVIVHGGPLTKTPQNPHNLHELYWQPWVKSELKKNEIECSVPAMPNPWQPKYEEWKIEFEKQEINPETILVCHSRGVAFLLRWLAETKQPIRKLIMVAPNLHSEGNDPVVCEFYNYELDLGIGERVDECVVFTSENDDAENIESAEILAKKLNCKVINLPNHGHYITEEMGCDEFPELVESILS